MRFFRDETDRRVCADMVRTGDCLPGPLDRWGGHGEGLHMLDLGAFAGYSSVLLSLAFPHARVAAVEADPENYAMLVKNTRGRGVKTIHAAVWPESGEVCVPTLHIASNMRRATLGGDGIRAMTIGEILDALRWKHAQYVKMDIEGAELAVVEHGEDWCFRVGSLRVECHDDKLEAVHGSLRDLGYRVTRGEKPDTLFASR